MKRRDFFIKGGAAVIATGVIPLVSSSCASPKDKIYDRDRDKWYDLGTGKTGMPSRKKTVDYDVVVIG